MFWKRVTKQQAEAAAPSAQEIAAAQGASRRLGRLVERQRSGPAEETPAPSDTARALLAAFADNAFLVLGVPMQADGSAVARAVDDLAFAEDADPRALEDARMQLLAPRERLRHELAWLPGCSPAMQSEACAAIRAGDADAVDRLRFGVNGLARVNLAAALLQASPGDADKLKQVLGDMERCDWDAARAHIDAARQAAGFRACDPVQFAQAADGRRDALAALAAEAALASREGRQALSAAIAANRDAVRSARGGMIEEVANRYARAADPQLARLRGQMDEAMAALRANPRDPARVTAILTTLGVWSQLRLPVQQLEQARGLADTVSEGLFESLRDLGIELANGHKLADDVLRLCKGMNHAFANVPGLADRLEEDIRTLTGNVLVAQLEDRCLKVAHNLGPFRAEVHRYGFGAGCGTIVAQLVAVFEELLEARPEAESAFSLLHQLAIAVANRTHDRVCALAMVEWLLAQAPPGPERQHLTQSFCQLQPPRA